MDAAKNRDLRILCFYKLLGISLLCLSVQRMWRSTQDVPGLGIEGFLKQAELYAWTPGLFLSNELHLLLNWGCFLILSGCVIFGRYRNIILGMLLVVVTSHFFSIPGRVSNNFFVVLLSIGILTFVPRSDSKDADPNSEPLTIVLLRHLMLLTYAFAVLHKLNASYFSIEDSALRAVFPGGVYQLFSTLNEASGLDIETLFFSFLIPASLIVELAIPVLLSIRRTRLVGCLCGLIFHASITYFSGIVDYTVVILSFFVLFLTEADFKALVDRIKRCDHRKWWTSVGVALALESLVLFMGSGLSKFPDVASGFFWVVDQAIAIFVLFVSVYCIYTILAWMLEQRTVTPLSEPRMAGSSIRSLYAWIGNRRGAFILIVLFDCLYVLNCMGPYLGAKYYYSQTMFSGLEMDTRNNNHFFLPYVRVFENDTYLKIQDLNFTPEIEPYYLESNRGLQLLLKNQEDSWVEKNFLFSVLSHASRDNRFHVSVTFVEDTPGSEPVQWRDIRDYQEELGFHPFNLYPWFKEEG